METKNGLEEESLGSFNALAQLRRLMSYVGALRWLLVVCAIGSMASTAIQLINPLLVRAAVDGYMSPQPGMSLSYRVHAVMGLAVWYACLLLLNLGLGYAVSLGLNHVGQNVVLELRRQVWRHYHRLPMSYFDRNPVGRLMTRVANDAGSLAEMFTSVVATGVGDILMFLGVLCIMFSLKPSLCLLVGVLFPPLLALTVWFKNSSQKLQRQMRVLMARVNSFLQENVQGIAVVKSFAAEARMQDRFARINDEYCEVDKALKHLFAVFRPLVSAATTVATAIVLWRGGLQVMSGDLTLGTLVAFLFYVRMLFAPIDELAEKFNVLQEALVGSERIFRILDTPVEPGIVAEVGPPRTLHRSRGHVRFENVSFAYDADKPVLRDVSFEIRPGETVALVGPSGSGKTTIASLLLRFYAVEPPNTGRIFLDDRPLEEWDVAALRAQFALVAQDLFLFSTDLLHNITLFADLPPAAVESALQVSQASRVVEKFPDGLQHLLNERGTTLSQGERQLLSFARALAVDPPVLILDEATASIDSKTEQTIQEALHRILENRSALIVAHRLSTVQEADRILVMHKGAIVEQGTHGELLELNGLYAHLLHTQQL